LFFSIITPTFNSAKYLKKHIDSLNQQSKIFEQIFVDNLSTDTTVQIIKDNAKYPYKIISEKDFGIYYAMNKGAKTGIGNFLLFLNTDDWLEEDTFKYVKNKIVTNPGYDIYYGNTRFFRENKFIFAKKSNIKKINLTNSLSHQATYYSKNIFKDFKYDADYQIAADYDLNLKLIKNGFKFFYLNNYLSNNTLGGFSSNLLISFKDFFRIQKKYNGLLKGTIYSIFEYKFKIAQLVLKKIHEKKN
jgi:glycosyltransferase involved in cell wall biosynthesis